MKCPHCNYEWTPRVQSPKGCPHCSYRLQSGPAVVRQKSTPTIRVPLPQVKIPKIRGFWLLGPAILALFLHAYLTVTGSFSTLSIVDYQSSQIFGYLEAFVTIVLTPVFLWKLAVWSHDRPYVAKHVWDDQNILD